MARYDGILSALAGALGQRSSSADISLSEDDSRLDGQRALVTGANTGLGRAVARQLAQRGADLVVAGRTDARDVWEEFRSTGRSVEYRYVDLSDLQSVRRLVETLGDGAPFDVVVSNAGVVPGRARRTPQGIEEMFAVNFLSCFMLLDRLLDQGLIRGSRTHPRIVIVTSESHRSARPIDWERFGAFRDYGMGGSMAEYATNKFLLTALARELGRRRAQDDFVAVHSICPGPVNSRIAREAPAWAQPLLGLVFTAFFRSPEAAAKPVVHLASSSTLEGQTGIYLHHWTPKEVHPEAEAPETGDRLFRASQTLISRLATGPVSAT